MDIILSSALLILLMTSVLLYLKLQKQHKSLVAAHQQLLRLSDILDGVVDNKDMVTAPPTMRVTVTLHDPVAVAKRQSIPAQFVGDLAPSLISKKVYQQVKREIAKSMEEHDIEADIQIETY